MAVLFAQCVRDMVYAHRIKVAALGPQEEVEGSIERPFEWVFFEMPVTEVGVWVGGSLRRAWLYL